MKNLRENERSRQKNNITIQFIRYVTRHRTYTFPIITSFGIYYFWHIACCPATCTSSISFSFSSLSCCSSCAIDTLRWVICRVGDTTHFAVGPPHTIQKKGRAGKWALGKRWHWMKHGSPLVWHLPVRNVCLAFWSGAGTGGVKSKNEEKENCA